MRKIRVWHQQEPTHDTTTSPPLTPSPTATPATTTMMYDDIWWYGIDATDATNRAKGEETVVRPPQKHNTRDINNMVSVATIYASGTKSHTIQIQ